MSEEQEVEKWRTLEKEEQFHCRVFQIDRVRNQSPGGERLDDFFIIRSPDWVNVIALTSRQEVVMIEQYRHGIDKITLEIPGGMIDAIDKDPIEAGVRELREETGYVGKNPRLIGTVEPNPALQSNVCHSIVVEDAEKLAELELDPNEEIVTRLIPLKDIRGLIADGIIRHVMVIGAFYHLGD